MAKMMMMVMTRRRREGGGGGVDDDVGFGREMITFWLLLFRLLSRKTRGPFFPWTKLASLPSSCSLSWPPHECLPVFSLFFLRKDSLRPSFSPVSFSEGGEGFNCLFAQLSHPPPLLSAVRPAAPSYLSSSSPPSRWRKLGKNIFTSPEGGGGGVIIISPRGLFADPQVVVQKHPGRRRRRRRRSLSPRACVTGAGRGFKSFSIVQFPFISRNWGAR